MSGLSRRGKHDLGSNAQAMQDVMPDVMSEGDAARQGSSFLPAGTQGRAGKLFTPRRGVYLLIFLAMLILPQKNAFWPGIGLYWTDVCVNVGLYALLGLSLNVILGQAGLFHMGHAAFYAIGAYATGILNTMYNVPIFWTMPVAGLLAGMFALLIAAPIIRLRGDYLLLVTIGVVEIVRIALKTNVFGITGGADGIFGIARPTLWGLSFAAEGGLEFFKFKIMKPIHFYYLVWLMVLITMFLFRRLENSRFGRALNYIKEDELAAQGSGVDTGRYKLAAFVLGAVWAGMAGTVYAAKMGTISPDSFNFEESVRLFAIVILGGCSQRGVLLGAVVLIALPEFFRGFESARMLIFGLAMVVVMIFRPQGILPPLPRHYRLPWRRAASAGASPQTAPPGNADASESSRENS